MHNHPMPRPSSSLAAGRRPLSVVLLAVVLSLFLALSACAGDSEPGGSDESQGESDDSRGKERAGEL